MSVVTKDYLNSLPPIYRDILSVFPKMEPARRPGYGLAFQSLYAALEGKYPAGDVNAACDQLVAGGAVQIKHAIFVHPTALGEELITALTGHQAKSVEVPPFTPPTGA